MVDTIRPVNVTSNRQPRNNYRTNHNQNHHFTLPFTKTLNREKSDIHQNKTRTISCLNKRHVREVESFDAREKWPPRTHFQREAKE